MSHTSQRRGLDPADPGKEMILAIAKMMDENPLYAELPKPDVKYIESFLATQPKLKSMTEIERREHLMNIVILGWIRDRMFVKFAKIIEKHPDDWEEYIEPKVIRLMQKIIETQAKIIPEVFKATASGFEEHEISKILRIKVIKQTAEIKLGAEESPQEKLKMMIENGDVMDADYEVVDEDGEKEKDEEKSS